MLLLGMNILFLTTASIRRGAEARGPRRNVGFLGSFARIPVFLGGGRL